MGRQIFPAEILEFTLEHTLQKHSTKSQAVYVALTLAVLGFIASLPFIHVDVSVQSRGVLRPKHDMSVINAPGTGKIKDLLVSENQNVSLGDTLMVLESPGLIANQAFLKDRIAEIQKFDSDLEHLLSQLSASPLQQVTNLKSDLYRQEYKEYKEEITMAEQAYLKRKQDWQRSEMLFAAGAVAAMEHEDVTYEYDNARANLRTVHQSFLGEWQDQLSANKREIQKLGSEWDQLKVKVSEQVVLAPIDGSVQELAGIYKGSWLAANQQLFKISPGTALEVECYVTPADIGWVEKGKRVVCQIDAFNYNQWGAVAGTISDISNDVILVEGEPVFKVTSTLDQDFLVLQNGYKGRLKKGMTLNARFVLTERSLWQLLYDKVDNWLNPALNPG